MPLSAFPWHPANPVRTSSEPQPFRSVRSLRALPHRSFLFLLVPDSALRFRWHLAIPDNRLSLYRSSISLGPSSSVPSSALTLLSGAFHPPASKLSLSPSLHRGRRYRLLFPQISARFAADRIPAAFPSAPSLRHPFSPERPYTPSRWHPNASGLRFLPLPLLPSKKVPAPLRSPLPFRSGSPPELSPVQWCPAWRYSAPPPGPCVEFFSCPCPSSH